MDVQKFVNQPTVGAIHELPLLLTKAKGYSAITLICNNFPGKKSQAILFLLLEIK